MKTRELTYGECTLAIRGLRYLISGERKAINEAVVAAKHSPRSRKHALYAEDVKRQAEKRIYAAESLIAKLRPTFKEFYDGRIYKPSISAEEVGTKPKEV